MRRLVTTFSVYAGLYLLLNAAPLAAFHDGDHGEGPTDRTFKVSKTGEVKIGTDVKVGTVLVKRGTYMLMHRAEDGEHVFTLTEINKKKDATQLVTFEFESSFLANSERVKNSSLLAREFRDHSYEVVKIQIAGEDGDHMLASNLGGQNANSASRN